MAFDKKSLAVGLEEYLRTGFRPVSNMPSVIVLKSLSDPIVQLVFNYKTVHGGYSFQGVVKGEKMFPEVEDLLEKFSSKYNLKFDRGSIRRRSRRIEELFGNKKYYIYKKEDIENISPFLDAMINEDILPFLNKFTTIGDVYEYLEGLKLEEMADFITDPFPARRMVLKGLLKTPDFESYSNSILAHYKENVSKHPMFARDYQYMPALYKELCDMQ